MRGQIFQKLINCQIKFDTFEKFALSLLEQIMYEIIIKILDRNIFTFAYTFTIITIASDNQVFQKKTFLCIKSRENL
jgi:hypothetical protein